MRRQMAAVIGVAFCLGALTALWAARPWDRATQSERIAARYDDGSPTGAPIGSVGTYGESGRRLDVAPLGEEPVPPLPPPPSDHAVGSSPASAPPGFRPNEGDAAPPAELRGRLVIPVEGVKATELQSTFHAPRGTGTHEAIDVLAPKGTAVLAVDDGTIVKLFYSVRGGKTIYQFERSGRYCYYYAHLDRYASGLAEGQEVKGGEVIGYVGSTGNADAEAPHLHFAIFRLGPEKRWWQGTPVDPFPVLAAR